MTFTADDMTALLRKLSAAYPRWDGLSEASRREWADTLSGEMRRKDWRVSDVAAGARRFCAESKWPPMSAAELIEWVGRAARARKDAEAEMEASAWCPAEPGAEHRLRMAIVMDALLLDIPARRALAASIDTEVGFAAEVARRKRETPEQTRARLYNAGNAPKPEGP